jgi:hypothetical protein
MTYKESGHFAAKHPAQTKVEPRLMQAVTKQLEKGSITCIKAHEIAQTLQAEPKQVGIAIDLQEGRIIKCQLGLFGYDKGQKKVKPADVVDSELRIAIEKALADGRLPCLDAWRIAEQRGLSRLALANACESLGIKIKPCQLGAF